MANDYSESTSVPSIGMRFLTGVLGLACAMPIMKFAHETVALFHTQGMNSSEAWLGLAATLACVVGANVNIKHALT